HPFRCFAKCGRAYKPMLHARQLAFGHIRVSMKKVVSDNKAEHGIADELKRLVMKATRFGFVASADLLVRPRAVREGAFEQRAVVETVADYLFQPVKVWSVGL